MSVNEDADRSRGDQRAEDKAIVQALVRDQLAELAPDELDELPLVFDTVYRSAERQLDRAVERSEPEDGLPFDASFVLGTALTTAIWVVSSLIRAHRIEASTAQRAELVRRLGERAGSEARVRQLETQVDRLLAAVDRLSDALEDRERTLREARRDLVPSSAGAPLSAEPPLPPLPDEVSPPLDGAGAELTLLVVERRLETGKYHLLGYRLLGIGTEGEPIHLHCRPQILRREPAPYIDEILSGEGGPTAARVGKLGTFLGKRLLPPELRRRLQELGRGSATLQVFPEEPGIPWEILRLPPAADRKDGVFPFLADVFALSQWPGDGDPPLHLGAKRIALIAPEDSDLPEATAEVAHLEELAGNGREVVRIPARSDAVSEALTAGGFDILHFTGHGVAPGRNPERWSLVLEGGETLNPVDLASGLGETGSRPPLVFLNACHSAREGWSLIGIGGLAAAFLEAGAGAVVGANWAVADAAARAFAEELYRHFLAGTPIAEAARRARRLLRERVASVPTSLAYTVLAHPGARCSVTRP